jgi:hypothetical protein
MEKIDSTVRIHIQLIGFAVVWGAFILLSQPLPISNLWDAIRVLPEAVTIYVILGYVFIKFLWRLPLFQGWLVKIPNLQGTWRGELKSDWIDPSTGRSVGPIQVALVIKQDFSSIICTLLTPESSSYSITADINFGVGGADHYLTYNYTNRPRVSVRDRSEIHDGAAILKIIRVPRLALEGSYWTSRKTTGELSLTYSSRELIEAL